MSPLKEVDEVQFYQWSKQTNKNYPEKSLHIEPGPEVLEIFKIQLSVLKEYFFLPRNQHLNIMRLPKKNSLLMKP